MTLIRRSLANKQHLNPHLENKSETWQITIYSIVQQQFKLVNHSPPSSQQKSASYTSETLENFIICKIIFAAETIGFWAASEIQKTWEFKA